MRRYRLPLYWFSLLLILFFGPLAVGLEAQTASKTEDYELRCTLIDDSGVIRLVPASRLKPEERMFAKCKPEKKKTSRAKGRPTPLFRTTVALGSEHEAKALNPEEVPLKGPVREFDMATPLGRLQVRWEVALVGLLGKRPSELAKEAWRAATRTVAKIGFPVGTRGADYQWSLVFMDQKTTEEVSPWSEGGCHPGWIRPPASIYISVGLLASQCGNGKPISGVKLQNEVLKTLYHEVGHALEYQLLGEQLFGRERYHSEGFAEWFKFRVLERLGKRNDANGELVTAMRSFSDSWKPSDFSGSAEDYSRAFAYIRAIADVRGDRQLFKIYKSMREQEISFEAALKQVTYWSLKRWRREVKKSLGLK